MKLHADQVEEFAKAIFDTYFDRSFEDADPKERRMYLMIASDKLERSDLTIAGKKL